MLELMAENNSVISNNRLTNGKLDIGLHVAPGIVRVIRVLIKRRPSQQLHTRKPLVEVFTDHSSGPLVGVQNQIISNPQWRQRQIIC